MLIFQLLIRNKQMISMIKLKITLQIFCKFIYKFNRFLFCESNKFVAPVVVHIQILKLRFVKSNLNRLLPLQILYGIREIFVVSFYVTVNFSSQLVLGLRFVDSLLS